MRGGVHPQSLVQPRHFLSPGHPEKVPGFTSRSQIQAWACTRQTWELGVRRHVTGGSQGLQAATDSIHRPGFTGQSASDLLHGSGPGSHFYNKSTC